MGRLYLECDAARRHTRIEWGRVREEGGRQLFAKLGRLNEKEREAIERTIDRIVNKLLHPPREALRDEARKGSPYGLIDALKCLFHLGE